MIRFKPNFSILLFLPLLFVMNCSPGLEDSSTTSSQEQHALADEISVLVQGIGFFNSLDSKIWKDPEHVYFSAPSWKDNGEIIKVRINVNQYREAKNKLAVTGSGYQLDSISLADSRVPGYKDFILYSEALGFPEKIEKVANQNFVKLSAYSESSKTTLTEAIRTKYNEVLTHVSEQDGILYAFTKDGTVVFGVLDNSLATADTSQTIPVGDTVEITELTSINNDGTDDITITYSNGKIQRAFIKFPTFR